MASKKTAPPRASATAGAPLIINIADVKETPPEGTLIHFTAEQWEGAIRDIPVGKALPKVGSRLTFYPLPDGGGVVSGDCISMPCEICRIRMRFDPETGQLFFECLCRPDPNCPEEPPVPPPSSVCQNSRPGRRRSSDPMHQQRLQPTLPADRGLPAGRPLGDQLRLPSVRPR